MSAGKNAAANVAFSGSQLLTALAITPLIQRGLGLEDFGLYVIFGQAANLLLITNPFPTNFVQWSVAREPDQLAYTIGAAQAAYRRGSWIYAAVASMVIVVLAASGALTIERSVALALLTVAFMIVRAAATYDFAMTGLMSQAAFIRKRVGINLAAGLVQVLVAQSGLGLIAIATVSISSSLMIFALQRRFIYARCTAVKPVSDWPVFRNRYAGESRQAYWGEVLYALNSWELVFLGFVASPAATAAFSITGSLQRQGWGLVNAAIAGALPVVGRLRTSGGDVAEMVVLRMNAGVAWLGVGAAALVVLVAEPIVTLLYGPGIYLGVVLAVPITALIVTTGLGSLNVQCWQYLGEARLGNRVLVGSLASAVIGGATGWWFAGMPGFVWGTWLGRAAAPMSTVFLLAKRRARNAIWPTFSLAAAWGAGVAMAWLTASQSRVVVLAVCSLVGVAVAVRLLFDLHWLRSPEGWSGGARSLA